jgi:hypothetical protein
VNTKEDRLFNKLAGSRACRYAFLWASAALLLFEGSGVSAAPDDLAEIARVGHRQVIDGIATFHARLHSTGSWRAAKGEPQNVTSQGEFWQSGPSIRWRDVMIDPKSPPKYSKGPNPEPVELRMETDGLVADGIVTGIHSLKQSDGYEQKSATLDVASDTQHSHIDPWQRSGCLVQSRPYIRLVDVLAHRDWIKRVEVVDVEGLPCLHVECEPEGKKVEAWLSVRHGLMVKRLRVGKGPLERGNSYFEYENDSFKDLGHGMFFPAHSFMRMYEKADEPGKPTGLNETFFDFVYINEPIPADTFRLTIPLGVRTFDRRTGKMFVMGKDGRPSPAQAEPIRSIGGSKVEIKAPVWPLPGGLAPKGPAIDVTKEIDVGFQPQGSPLEVSFLARNYGAQPLVLQNFTSSVCGHSVLYRMPSGEWADAFRHVVPPAASIELAVHFFSLGDPSGRFEYHVTFDTNDPNRPKADVRVTGRVEVGVYCLPRQLDLGRMSPGEVVHRTVRVVDGRRPDQRAMLRAVASSQVIRVGDMTPSARPADRAGATGDEPVSLFSISLTAPTNTSQVHETVSLVDGAGKLVGLIPVAGAVPSAPTLNPNEVLLLPSGTSGASAARRRCVYTNTAGPFSLTVTRAPPDLDVRVCKANWPGARFIDVEIKNESAKAGNHRVQLTAQFENGRSDRLEIPVVIGSLR